MDKKELQQRTKAFAVRVIKLIDALPASVAGRAVANQIVRAATSVGANYRAACQSRSKKEFVAKLGIVLEEADECVYWIEVIGESDMLKEAQLALIHKEAKELVAIFTKTIKTAKQI